MTDFFREERPAAQDLDIFGDILELSCWPSMMPGAESLRGTPYPLYNEQPDRLPQLWWL